MASVDPLSPTWSCRLQIADTFNVPFVHLPLDKNNKEVHGAVVGVRFSRVDRCTSQRYMRA